MGHSIRFVGFDGFILTQDEVRDLIELFYRWPDGRFTITTDEKERKFMGECFTDMGGNHTITLCAKNIRKVFARKGKYGRMGGNQPAPDLRTGAGMVVAHEVQHANQWKLHRPSEDGFYGIKGGKVDARGRLRKKRYKGRPAEVDARRFVDEHADEIRAYFGAPLQRAPERRAIGDHGDASREALAVAQALSELPVVAMDDVRDELRASRILNPGNVQVVIDELRRLGREVSSGPAQ